MDFLDAFLNVLAILGIIVAGAFVIFFLCDLLLTIIEPRRKDKKEETTVINYTENTNQEVDYSSYENYKRTKNNQSKVTEQVEEKGTVTAFVAEEPESMGTVTDFDYEEAMKEKQSLGIVEPSTPFAVERVVEAKEEVDDIDSLFNDDDFDFSDDFDFNFGDEEVQEEIKVMNDEIEALEEADKASEVIIEKAEDVVEAVKMAHTDSDQQIYENIQNTSDVAALTVVSNETAVNKDMEEEIARLKEELEKQRQEFEAMLKQAQDNKDKLQTEKDTLAELYAQAEQANKEEATIQTGTLSLVEYESRLETLKARLKANEKELKENKKEFLPLRKVKKTLDTDRKKLRRREALVAKQKVVLYGVNNITEIDEEKAKKLAEDLDLLDGLKVSVQHCEEVMEANKDRYPILETTYRILTTVNQDLKDDIKECEANISKLKNSDSDDGAVLVAEEIIHSAVANDNTVEAESAEAESARKEELVLVEAPRRGRKKKVIEPVIVENIEPAKTEAEDIIVEPVEEKVSEVEISGLEGFGDEFVQPVEERVNDDFDMLLNGTDDLSAFNFGQEQEEPMKEVPAAEQKIEESKEEIPSPTQFATYAEYKKAKDEQNIKTDKNKKETKAEKKAKEEDRSPRRGGRPRKEVLDDDDLL